MKPIVQTDIIEKTTKFVQQTLADAESGHDWNHIKRVWLMSKRIISTEPEADSEIVELAALLHDIADSKFHQGDESIGPRMAKEFLQRQEYHEIKTEHIINIIKHMSFKNSLDSKSFESLEMKIVQDADKLDAIGAIGIARTFHYGGYKNQAINDPNIPARSTLDKMSYKSDKTTSINHFYEKLLKLKDMMHTSYGRSEAEKRHQFLLDFLDQFNSEWSSS